MRFLAETAGATTEHMFLQNLPVPNPKTYVGSGKIEEIRDYVKSKDISLVIFDDELSPSQLRNIEKILEYRLRGRHFQKVCVTVHVVNYIHSVIPF